jgi:hypothetical protein
VDTEDLRLPHQRFAAACLALLADHDQEEIRRPLSEMICVVLADPQWPLQGKAIVLDELHRVRRIPGQWERALQQALDQSWNAKDEQEVQAAATFLRHVYHYLANQGKVMKLDHEKVLVGWMNKVLPTNCVELGYLINDIGGRDRALATRVIMQSDPVAVAALLRQASPEVGSKIGHYLLSLSFAAQTPWREQLKSNIGSSELIRVISGWSGSGKSENSDLYALSSLSHLCYGLCWLDENLVYELLAAAMPFAQSVFADRTAEALSCYSDVCDFVLRFSDLFEGDPDYRPQPWHLEIARQLTARVDAKRTASQLASAFLNNYQRSANLLRFVRITNMPLFLNIVTEMDWHAVIHRVASHVNAPLMEIEHLLAMAWCEETEPRLHAASTSWIATLDTLPARLAVMFPDLAWAHVLAGKTIQLTRHWPSGAGVIAIAAEERPELLQTILEPHRSAINQAIVDSSRMVNTEFGMFLENLIMAAPGFWSSLLMELDVIQIESVWRDQLSTTGNDGALTAFVVRQCLAHPGAVGDLARDLDREFKLCLTQGGGSDGNEGSGYE